MANTQAAMKVNAEQASKRVMYRPTGQSMLGRLKPQRDRAMEDLGWLYRGIGGGMCGRGKRTQHGKSQVVEGEIQQEAGDGRTWRLGMADGPVIPMRPGNAGGGKGPWFKTDA